MSEAEAKNDTAETKDAAASTEGAATETSPDPLALLTAERDKFRDQLLRTAADFDNFRKRTRKELEDAQKRATEDTIREVLPIADNLERAVQAAATAVDAKSVADGVRMVLALFSQTIERLGIERTRSVGQKFDPNLHEAIQQIETAEHPPGTIVLELAPGYKLGERLIRAALVAVAKAPVTETAVDVDAPTAAPTEDDESKEN